MIFYGQFICTLLLPAFVACELNCKHSAITDYTDSSYLEELGRVKACFRVFQPHARGPEKH